MEEILPTKPPGMSHEPCKWWGNLSPKWCRMQQPSTATESQVRTPRCREGFWRCALSSFLNDQGGGVGKKRWNSFGVFMAFFFAWGWFYMILLYMSWDLRDVALIWIIYRMWLYVKYSVSIEIHVFQVLLNFHHQMYWMHSIFVGGFCWCLKLSCWFTFSNPPWN